MKCRSERETSILVLKLSRLNGRHSKTCNKCITHIKVCFVVCDNVFSQIFYNCSNVEEIFYWNNCRKMCSKNFENRLINKNVLVKNIFEYGFPVQKSHGREGNIFPQKF